MGEALAAEAFDGRTAMTFTLALVGAVTHLSFGEGVAADDAGANGLVIEILHRRGSVRPFGEAEAGEKRAVYKGIDRHARGICSGANK